jgi:hypothetical protein
VLIAYKASLPFEKKGEEKVTEIFMYGRVAWFRWKYFVTTLQVELAETMQWIHSCTKVYSLLQWSLMKCCSVVHRCAIHGGCTLVFTIWITESWVRILLWVWVYIHFSYFNSIDIPRLIFSFLSKVNCCVCVCWSLFLYSIEPARASHWCSLLKLPVKNNNQAGPHSSGFLCRVKTRKRVYLHCTVAEAWNITYFILWTHGSCPCFLLKWGSCISPNGPLQSCVLNFIPLDCYTV